MADVKISELPAVSSLNTTDVLPAVAGSQTSKITLQNFANTIPQVSSSISASYSTTSDSAKNSVLASTASIATTASFASTASFVESSSFASTASFVESSSFATSASFSISASWAPQQVTSPTASYVTASNVYGPFDSNSVISASFAVSASWAPSAGGSSVIAATGSTLYSTTPAAALPSNTSTENSIFFGTDSGFATRASASVFLGYQAGYSASNAYQSTFIGQNSGYLATRANRSVFIGHEAGYSSSRVDTGAKNVYVGFRAGYGANNIYSVFIGDRAGLNDTNWAGWGNNFIGLLAGAYATSGSTGSGTEFTNAIGYVAGYSASYSSYSNFIGWYAGYEATQAYISNFIGANAGYSATNAIESNFIGDGAGSFAINAKYSNFFGTLSGEDASNASYSNLIGYRTGKRVTSNGIGTNNIIIGNSITLENDRRDSINIGGLIFGTGSYYSAGTGTTGISSGSANGRIGINIVNPTQALDVSGSVQISQVLVLPPQNVLPSGVPTGSIAVSGSGVECKPYFWNGSTWTSLI